MNLFVAKLNFSTRNESLQAHFEQFGEVEKVHVVMDRETGRSKGYGFVEMPNDAEAQNAINTLNESEFEGSTIYVKQAEPRENRDNNTRFRSGGGGGGNRGGYSDRPARNDRWNRD
jgi:RNA recognition motif-containing protein